jgi:hypothetical protein
MEIAFVALLWREAKLFFLSEDAFMEKITEVLWSLIPLVLIIVFSWLFSLMGSKVKKQQPQGKEPMPGEGAGSPFLDMLLKVGQEEEEPRTDARLPVKEIPSSPMSLEPGAWNAQNVSSPTQISSEPITPKWWGA